MKKMETFSLKEPFAWEFFVMFFPHACPHFLILISVKKTEGHM